MMRKLIVPIFTSLAFIGCTSAEKRPALDTVPSVDMAKFMGDWYVIANIPTFVEKGAHNAIEHYDMNDDGSVSIRFTYFKNAFDGDFKKYTMTGTPVPGSNGAKWKVSPFWPVKFDYYTIELASDYSWVVVATPDRGYLWIMSRKPQMPPELLNEITKRMIGLGFKESEIQVVPQKW